MRPTALSTDLYELTMIAGYFASGLNGQATFELFVRRLPDRRAFLLAAGLEQALGYLETLAFAPDDIEFLRGVPNLQGAPEEYFTKYLPQFRFTGDVWAVDEGTPIYAEEPLLRVTAPLPQAQLVETALLSIVTFQTSIASKAARIVHSAGGRPVAEFGARRAHGLEAALHAARAAYLAGCAGTSYVEAGRKFGIPLFGTMAHSWVLAFPDEQQAFSRYAAIYGDRAVMLLDTYDTLEAVKRLAASKLRPTAVRLDSGDVVRLSKSVRQLLDASNLGDTRIFVTGELDEYRVAEIVQAGAPVDGFGVGTALTTASDWPGLGGVYKLVELERDGVNVGVRKLSPDKGTLPGRKQVWRRLRDGAAVGDVLALDDEAAPADAYPLLKKVMSQGRRVGAPPTLEQARSSSQVELARMPPDVLGLSRLGRYRVERSQALNRLLASSQGPAAKLET